MPDHAHNHHPVILTGWDGADAAIARTLAREGKLPVLDRLLSNGASGHLAGYAPFSSPMLWTTVATGKLPPHHGIHGWQTVRGGYAVMAEPRDRGAPAFWNVLAEHGISCGVVGWPVTHPAETIAGGVVASYGFTGMPPFDAETRWPVAPGSVSPPEMAAELEELRVRVTDLDPGLLGLFISRAAELDERDNFYVAVLMRLLAELYTTHNTAIRLAEMQRCVAVQYGFLARISEHFLKFHPPCVVDDDDAREAELFGGVVEAAYRVMDILTGDLWKTAGGAAEAALMIISPHPPEGLLAMGGRGVSKADLSRARLEDVTPTLLALLGAPAHTDMPGRVLAEALETVPPERVAVAQGDEHFLTEALAEETPADEEDRESAEAVRRKNDLNLGISLMALGRAAEALAPLERCHFAEPEAEAPAYHVARCRMRLGMFPEAKRALFSLEDAGATRAAALLRAEIALAENRSCEALAALAALEPEDALTGAHAAERQRLRWQALLLEKQYLPVAEEIRATLKARPAEEMDLILLSHARLCAGDFREAAELAERALAGGGRYGAAYNLLGQALERLGETARAREIYAAWLAVEPGQEFAVQRAVALAKDPPRPLPKVFEPSLVRARTQEWLRVRGKSLEESAARLAEVRRDSHHDDSPAPWRVRPPREDEWQRLARHFGIVRTPHALRVIGTWVTVAGPEERIVSGYQLLQTPHDGGAPDTGATVRFSMRPRWCTPALMAEALRVMERAATEHGLTSLRLEADPESAEGMAWEALGFTKGMVREKWHYRFGPYLDELLARILSGPAEGGEWVEPLSAAHLPEVREICSALDLLDPSRVTLLGEPDADVAEAFDPRLSFVVRDEKQVLGILLARMMGHASYMEVMAKRPEAGRPTTKVVAMLVERFIRENLGLGIRHGIATLRPALAPGQPRLIRRSQGEVASRSAWYGKEV